MRRIEPRLLKLEAVAPAGRATCRGWCGTVLVDDDGNRGRPERCPDCGRLVRIRVLLHLVGIPLDAL